MDISKKAVILVTSQKLALIAQKAVKNLELDIYVELISVANLENTIQLLLKKVEEYKQEGIKFIITVPGGKRFLQDKVDINILDIEINEYDILKSLYKYKFENKNIAIIECEEVIEKAKYVSDVLEINASMYSSGHKDAYKHIERAINTGSDVIISSSGIVHESEKEIIEENNVMLDEIEPSEKSVEDVIKKARDMYNSMLKEEKEAEMIKTILDFTNEGIISVDIDKKITTFNPKAEKITKIKSKDALGRYVKDVILDISLTNVLESGKMENGVIVNINDIQIICDIIPLFMDDNIIGAILTFQRVDDIQKIEQKIRVNLSKKGLTAKYKFSDIKGISKKIQKVVEIAKIYSNTSSNVLITGETGTGKEVFAQSIHNKSDRKDYPFVAINCAAIPSNLLESELFGYVGGAFTGAKKEGKQGIFELANKGTIFLDEIGEIDKSVQVRLLRVLQEREVMRIGGDEVIPIDVRVISATNKNLYNEVQKGNFREDLYFRLEILSLNIPPLRDRKEDLEDLVKTFLEKMNKQHKCKVIGFDKDILKIIKEYNWPGNVRELENMIEKLVVITRSGIVKCHEMEYFSHRLNNEEYDKKEDIYRLTLEEIEKDVITKVLEDENYNKVKTAKRLGIDRTTLSRKIEKFKKV